MPPPSVDARVDARAAAWRLPMPTQRAASPQAAPLTKHAHAKASPSAPARTRAVVLPPPSDARVPAWRFPTHEQQEHATAHARSFAGRLKVVTAATPLAPAGNSLSQVPQTIGDACGGGSLGGGSLDDSRGSRRLRSRSRDRKGESASRQSPAAALGVEDAVAVSDLAAACAAQSRLFDAQDAARSLWSAATLGVRDDAVVGPLALACAARARSLNARDAANSLWAAATLGVRDDAIVGPLAAACVAQSRSLDAQGAADSLWAAAMLDLRDAAIVGPLGSACAARAHFMSAQSALSSMWVGAALDLRDAAFFRALAGAALGSSLTLEQVDQLLYVHAATRQWLPAPLFSPELLSSCRARSLSERAALSGPQRDIAASLTRIGFSVEPYDLPGVDILVQVPDGAVVAVDFFSRSNFLRWIDSAASGGRLLSPNGGVLFRLRLLREAGFDVLVVPFVEWDALVDDSSRDAFMSSLFVEFFGELE